MNILRKGIDISAWQGSYNLKSALSEGFDFVVIKGGGGDDGLYVDSKFSRNYDLAKSLGMSVGVYWFSKALTVSDAVKEADYFFENCLKGRQFDLPVYIDVENKTQLAIGKRLLTDVVKSWCKRLESKGFFVGIYSSQSYFSSYMNDDELQDYAHWVACWSSDCDYKGESFGMWQYGGETNYIRSSQVAGQTTDQDYLLIDYPVAIKEARLNGYQDVMEPESPVSSNRSVQRLLDIARAELGYLEKKSNSQLDDKLANAGDQNYTKYARDLANAGYYQASKQGYEWCDVFVDWCFHQLCDGNKEEAEAMHFQSGPYGAGCYWSAMYYKQADRYFTSDPKPGDQIFFGDYDHTGLVEKVSNGVITTIEGNASNSVKRLTYKVDDSWINGFGRPQYDISEVPSDSTTGPEEYTLDQFIRDVQGAIGAEVDGIAGPETISKTVTISSTSNNYHKVVEFVQKRLYALGYTQVGDPDGIAGPLFDGALKAFQRDNGCIVDGEATSTYKTWKKLLGME